MITLFLVDDDDSFLESLMDFLGLYERFHIVGTAPDGQAALNVLLTMEEPPTLIVSDIMMPGLDGFELAAALDSHLGGEARVLLLTAAEVSRMRRRLPAPGVLAIHNKLAIIDDLPTILDALTRHTGS